MTYIEGQIIWLNAMILRDHARIVSGAYKTRQVFHSTETNPDKQLTEEELLQSECRTMDQHIKWLNETIECLAKDKEQTVPT